MSDDLFAERHGFAQPKAIVYREDLPQSLVAAALRILIEATNGRYIRDTCQSLFDPYQTSGKFFGLKTTPEDLSILRWYELYSLIEHVTEVLIEDDKDTSLPRHLPGSAPLPPPLDRLLSSDEDDPSYDSDQELRAPRFRTAINGFFVHEGIGWQLDHDGKIVTRGDENFTASLEGAISTLGKPGDGHLVSESRLVIADAPLNVLSLYAARALKRRTE